MSLLTPAYRPHGRRRWRRHTAPLILPSVNVDRRQRRITGWLGLLFAGLTAAATALITLPTSGQTAHQIAAHFADGGSPAVIAAALLIGAAVVLFVFAGRLPDSIASTDRPAAVEWTGRSVAVIAVAVGLAILVLALFATGVSPEVSERLGALLDGSSVILYLAIAGFTVTVGFQDTDLPFGFRALAGVMGVLATARAFAGWADVPTTMDVAAPLAFVVFVAVLGVWLVTRSSVARDRTGRG